MLRPGGAFTVFELRLLGSCRSRKRSHRNKHWLPGFVRRLRLLARPDAETTRSFNSAVLSSGLAFGQISAYLVGMAS